MNKCNCFCTEYKCPRDRGTAAFCKGGPKESQQAVVFGSKHNVAKAVEVVEKRDCATDCEALYQNCVTVSPIFGVRTRLG